MHIYTLAEVSYAAIRLTREGMPLKHAVQLTAGSYGFDPQDIYLYIAKHNLTGE